MAPQINSTLITNSLFHTGFMPDAVNVNQQILEAYLQLEDKDFIKRTHFFYGRYENIYLQRERIPAIEWVLVQAEKYASDVLQIRSTQLRSGFWINEMKPGAVTTEHDHDENDELLSGVYYVHAPNNSGELNIIEKYSKTVITPQAGMFVFFAPTIRHSVGKNNTEKNRISLGMNFGLT